MSKLYIFNARGVNQKGGGWKKGFKSLWPFWNPYALFNYMLSWNESTTLTKTSLLKFFYR